MTLLSIPNILILSDMPCTNVLNSCREQYPTLAPHGALEAKVVEVSNHPVVTKARKGDVLRVMRNVGGGGGHSLTVRDLTMRIAHKHEI